MRRTMLFALVLAICLPVAVCAADWAQFRGPNADGISPEKGIGKDWKQKPPKMLWKVAMSDDGYAGPSVAGGKVFIIDHTNGQDVVRAIDLGTGKAVWKYAYSDTDAPNYGYSRATPTVSAGRVYAHGRMGLLNCLDAKTGRKLWSRDLFTEFNGKKPTWLYAGSPVIDGNKVIMCPGGSNASMVALDKATGKTIWQGGGSDIPGYATPVIATIGGVRQYVVFTGVSVISVDAATGKLLWSLPWKTAYDINGSTAIVLGTDLFMTSGYGHGCELLDLQSGRPMVKWGNKGMQCRFSSPVVLDGMIYGISEPGDLVCMDAAKGDVKWRQGGFGFGGLIAIDGVLMALADGGNSGDLVMVRPSPESYQEMGRFKPLGDQSWTAPVISDGLLIVRNKYALACFSLK